MGLVEDLNRLGSDNTILKKLAKSLAGGNGDGEGGEGRSKTDAGVAVAVGRGDWPGAGWRPGQVTLHRTLPTGAQVGYIRDGSHYRLATRGDVVTDWQVHSVLYQSWVDIANLLDSGAAE